MYLKLKSQFCNLIIKLNKKITSENKRISMIKPSNFRQTLGITQEEAAILLKTTKSQIAMFELGLRELPTSKMLKLVTFYKHVIGKQQQTTALTDSKEGNNKCLAMLEQELKNSQVKILLLSRELERLKVKHQKNVAALELVALLETELPKKEQPSPEFIALLRRKALKGIEKNDVSVQLKCEIAIKSWQLYQRELKKELERFTQSS